MKKGFCIFGRVMSGLLFAAILNMGVRTGAAGQTRATDTTTTSSTQTAGTTVPAATGGADDKTYISSGAEGAGAYVNMLLDPNYIPFKPNKNLLEKLNSLPKDENQEKSNNLLPDGTPENNILRALRTKLLEVDKHALANLRNLATALPKALKGLIEQPSAEPEEHIKSLIVPNAQAFTQNRSTMYNYLITDLAKYGTAERDVLYVLLHGSKAARAELTDTEIEAGRNFIRQKLPPLSLSSYSFRSLSGEGRPNYSPALTYTDVIRGYDLAAQGQLGSINGAGLSFRQDFSDARKASAHNIAEAYKSVARLGISTGDFDKDQAADQKTATELSHYLDAIAIAYPIMWTRIRYSANVAYDYFNVDPMNSNSNPRHYSVVRGGMSLSQLVPLGYPTGDGESRKPVWGVMPLISAQYIQTNGTNSGHALRLAVAVTFQDKVPYYVRHDSQTRNAVFQHDYTFDHWRTRFGAEIANKTHFDARMPWDIFVRWRDYPHTTADIPMSDLIRRDIQYTVAFGATGDRATAVTFRIDRNF
jgi:hypothetical protein